MERLQELCVNFVYHISEILSCIQSQNVQIYRKNINEKWENIFPAKWEIELT